MGKPWVGWRRVDVADDVFGIVALVRHGSVVSIQRDPGEEFSRNECIANDQMPH